MNIVDKLYSGYGDMSDMYGPSAGQTKQREHT
jgi:hypothetical protein